MKKLLLFLCFLLASAACYAQAPVFQWAKRTDGHPGSVNSTVMDLAGNVYMTGYFAGTVDFDPGTAVFNLVSSANSNDIFISKFDASGNFVWAKRIGDKQYDAAVGLAVDAQSNVYITGNFRDTVDFDPGAGTHILMAPQSPFSNISQDQFVLKLNQAGDLLWVYQENGTPAGAGWTITPDQQGNILIASGNTMSKLDANGNMIWTEATGTPATIISITADAAGNVYTTGTFGDYFYNVCDLDPGPAVNNFTSHGVQDVFVSKLDPNGNFLWAKGIGGNYQDNGNTIAVSAQGNVYIAGTFQATADFDPGPAVSSITTVGTSGNNDIFVMKLDASGNYVWARSWGSELMDYGGAMAIDAGENVYVSSYLRGAADLDPGAGVYNMTDANGRIYLSKLNDSGDFKWAMQLGTSGYYDFNTVSVASGSICMTGIYSYSMDCDPGPGIHSLDSSGTYVVKLLQANTGILTPALSNCSIYPNPTSGIFTITVLQPTKNAAIEIYNTLGSLVYKQSNLKETNRIDLTNSADGVYFVRLIENDQTMTTQKIMKQ